MLKHGRAGVPLEVMGLMLGEFIDATTISVSVCLPLISVCFFSFLLAGLGLGVGGWGGIQLRYQKTQTEKMRKELARGENT